MIQHLLHKEPDLIEISLLCNQIIVAESKGDMMLCLHINACLCISLLGCLFFSHVHTFLLSLLSVVTYAVVSKLYWFIISDSCDIYPYYSPLRTCFQSLLEMEPEKNNTHKMISGFNFNGNCSLFLDLVIFLGNNF